MRNPVGAWTAAAALVLAGSMYVTAQEPRPEPQAGGRGAPPQGLQQPRVDAGAGDRPGVDPAAAAEGKKIWGVECVNCHGPSARGTDNGPNLIRSLVCTAGSIWECAGSVPEARPQDAERPFFDRDH